MPDPDLGSLERIGNVLFLPFSLSDVGSYKARGCCHSVRSISHPHPVRIILFLLLPRDMELDFQIDTSWCMGCSKQILPKRSYTPVQQSLPPQPPTRTC